MRDLLVLDSNIVQIEDVGGSNPLCSTRRSPRTALGSRHPQSLGYVVRDRQLAGIDRGCVKTRGPRAHSFRGLWPRRAKKVAKFLALRDYMESLADFSHSLDHCCRSWSVPGTEGMRQYEALSHSR
jgi:hypothetical protein